MRLRDLSLDDYGAMVALWKKAGLPIRPLGRDSLEGVRDQLSTGVVSILGLEDEDRLVGIVVASQDGRKGWINRLAVDPDYRGQGWGARLINEAEKRLKKQGLRIIAALVEGDNLASLKLFQKQGYVRSMDVVYLSKRESDEV